MPNNDISKRNSARLNLLERATKAILNTVDPGYREHKIIKDKDQELQQIVNKYLERSRGVAADGRVVDWISNNIRSTQIGTSQQTEVDSTELFTRNIGDIYSYFKDVYKNKYIELTDLQFISKFIPSLGEAVKVTLESIVSSDNITTTITRNIVLPSSLTEDEKTQVKDAIETIEEEEKLLEKLMNVVYKKALISGSYVVYSVPYKSLFAQFQQMKETGKIGDGFVTGGKMRNNLSSTGHVASFRGMESYNFTPVIESIVSGIGDAPKNFDKVLRTAFDSIDIKYAESGTHLISALEEMSIMDKYSKTNNSPSSADPYGTTFSNGDNGYLFNEHGVRALDEIEKDFDKIEGLYIKYIDPKNIIPVRIFDKTIGYYHIHTENKKQNGMGNSSINSISNSIFSNVNMADQKKEDALSRIATAISDAIITNFSPEFVGKYTEHQRLIADCIIANGIVDNEYQIQFIPAEDIIEFKINENDAGFGTSILSEAIFPAKLLLSLKICKILNYMNNGGNKTVAHVSSGKIDRNSNNQLQRVTRMLQESKVTFNDLMATNLIFSKFSRDQNIQLPTSKGGTRLVDFEVQEGQQIDLGTQYEEMLEREVIMGTGVPSVIMEYVNQADFSKQIESGQIRWAGRVSRYQSDLEPPTTEFYRRILRYSGKLEPGLREKVANEMLFRLPRPKALVNANNADFLQTLYGLAQTTADITLGQQGTDQRPNIEKVRTKLIKKIVEQNSPFFDWEEIDKMVEQAFLEVAEDEEIADKNDQSEDYESEGF